MNDEILTIEQAKTDETSLFGFWVYLMTDLVLFASLFAVFVVLRGNPIAHSGIFNINIVLAETLLLLTSSFSCGLALLFAQKNNKDATLLFLTMTFVLGAAFVYLEVSEFAHLIAEGYAPTNSGFLSSYFTLVGTHGGHVSIGLLWMFALLIAITLKGLTRSNLRKLLLFSYFWHFLDIVWIFIFTIVYLYGLA